MHAFRNLQDMWRHIQGTNTHNEKQDDSYTLAHTHPNIYTHCEERRLQWSCAVGISGDEAVAVELGLKVF